ncbi:MAG: DUF4832 domain-containing protein [Flavobacteriales bacterium]|jgi:hypothetical protein|nr:DUF4832 domain-containing protein [Flavobacteriales bacterium]
MKTLNLLLLKVFCGILFSIIPIQTCLAQSNFSIQYSGIAPADISPFQTNKLGNIAISNPERGFSIRAGVIDIYSQTDFPDSNYFENISGNYPNPRIPLNSYLGNFENDGISLVETELYIHYKDSLQNNTASLSSSDLLKPKNEILPILESHGLKMHLILNSSFEYQKNGSDGVSSVLSNNGVRLNRNIAYLQESQTLFSELNTHTALVHLGWINHPWDFNHYRLSGHWKRSNFEMGINYPIGKIKRDIEYSNYHGTKRKSTQRSSWGQVHGEASAWEFQSSINHLKKNILNKTLSIFPTQKILLKSTYAIAQHIGNSIGVTVPYGATYPVNNMHNTMLGPFNTGITHDSVKNLKDEQNFLRFGYYDHAFGGDTYDSYWTICNGKAQEITWTSDMPTTIGIDWANNLSHTDAFNLRYYRQNLWMHGEMPTYETPDPINNVSHNPSAWFTSSFNRNFSYLFHWYESTTGIKNPQYDWETHEGMCSGKLQDGFYSALKLRYFNYTSFNITHNNLLDGRSPYEMPDGYTLPPDSLDMQALTGAGIPKKDSTAISQWKKRTLSKVELEQFGMPISDRYFKNKTGNDTTRSAYEYIRDHLGYRLELQKTDFIFNTDHLMIKTDLINRGFAAPQNKRALYFVILDENDEVVLSTKTHYDWRNWQPDTFAIPMLNYHNVGVSGIPSLDSLVIGGIPLGDQGTSWHHNPINTSYKPIVYSLKDTFNLAGLPHAYYQLGIVLPDPETSLHDKPKYAVRFANQAKYIPCSAITVLGSFWTGTNTFSDKDADGIMDSDDNAPLNPIQLAQNPITNPNTNCSLPFYLEVAKQENIHNKTTNLLEIRNKTILAPEQTTKLEIYSLAGKLVKGNRQNTISIEGILPGFYLVKYYIDGKYFAEKMVIK